MAHAEPTMLALIAAPGCQVQKNWGGRKGRMSPGADANPCLSYKLSPSPLETAMLRLR
jgi:hypothetical protein